MNVLKSEPFRFVRFWLGGISPGDLTHARYKTNVFSGSRRFLVASHARGYKVLLGFLLFPRCSCARMITGFDRFFCTYAQEMSSFVEFSGKEEGEAAGAVPLPRCGRAVTLRLEYYSTYPANSQGKQTKAAIFSRSCSCLGCWSL